MNVSRFRRLLATAGLLAAALALPAAAETRAAAKSPLSARITRTWSWLERNGAS